MFSLSTQLDETTGLHQVTVPDLWQQQAVAALREGKDVVVQAPTGSGKTLIFELWSNNGKNRGQAIYTVPTRALANDKLAEWRARGWDVGIATGDLAEDLGPILIFAPRRQSAESMAAELARQLPTPNPLQLSPEQKAIAGEHLSRLLKSRITYHHSGLSYAARAGVIEPLAKAGQLRVVVATMGLAAGINFSLRSVSLAAESYRRDQIEQPLKPDEILQMFGRAGRRGLDETGYVLISANELRLLDARPCHLSRSGAVDWSALLNLMSAAADQGRDPFAEAVQIQEKLFTTKPIFLGVEESLRHPDVPCGLHTDAERARHVRTRVRQMLNSRNEWENYPAAVERPLRQIVTPEHRNLPEREPEQHRVSAQEQIDQY